MEYVKKEDGFISIAPEFGAIFMSNLVTKRACLKHKVFGLPSSMANFVKEVKKGMILFLFEFESRQLFGVYRAISDGAMNIVPHAFSSTGKQFSAQVRIIPIWYCSPLSENEFRDAIRENYFSAKKFHFGLSEEQVHRLLVLFSSRKIKNSLAPKKLPKEVSSQVEKDGIMTDDHPAGGRFDIRSSDDGFRPFLSTGYPTSFRRVKRINSDIINHTIDNEYKIDSAGHVYFNGRKRIIDYDGRLLKDNVAEDKLHLDPRIRELGLAGNDWSSVDDRGKSEYNIERNHAPVMSNYLRGFDLGRTADDARFVRRDHLVNQTNMDNGFGMGRSTEHHGKPSDNDRTRFITQYAGLLRKDGVDKAHSMGHSHEPAISRKNKSDPLWNIGTASDDWHNRHSFLDDRVANEKCVDNASNEISGFAGDVGGQMVEAGNYPMNDIKRFLPDTEEMEPNAFGSLGYRTSVFPKPSMAPPSTRSEINDRERRRFSSQASIASHSFFGNNQCAVEPQSHEHTIWQESNRAAVGRRSSSPNTSWLYHHENVPINLDNINSPGGDIVNDENEHKVLTNTLHSDLINPRRSVFSRLSSAPKVSLVGEQEADHSMSYDEYHMDTTVDEVMDMSYQDRNVVPTKPWKGKPFVREIEYGEKDRSQKREAIAANNYTDQHDDLMMTKITQQGEDQFTEETVDHVPIETRVVDFKRRRVRNRGSEESDAKFTKEDTVFRNPQDHSSSENVVAKDSADKPSKRRKLVRPVFGENNSISDLNHQLPCQTLDKVSTANSEDVIELESAVKNISEQKDC